MTTHVEVGASLRWNIHGSTLERSLEQIEEAGYDFVEVCGLEEPDLPRLHSLLAAGAVDARSIHAPCPDGGLDGGRRTPGDWLASADVDEVATARHWARRSIELARDGGIPNVVFHMGRIDEVPGREEELWALAAQEGWSSPVLTAAVADYAAARRSYEQGARDRAARSVEVMLEVTGDEVFICLENRFRHMQLPTADDAVWLFERFHGAPLAYWFDTGHHHVQANLGLVDLDAHRGALLRARGAHVHDARGTSDHRPMGTADVDWAVLDELPPEAVLVAELSPSTTVDEARQAADFVRARRRRPAPA